MKTKQQYKIISHHTYGRGSVLECHSPMQEIHGFKYCQGQTFSNLNEAHKYCKSRILWMRQYNKVQYVGPA
jgi:hypothetical protein